MSDEEALARAADIVNTDWRALLDFRDERSKPVGKYSREYYMRRLKSAIRIRRSYLIGWFYGRVTRRGES